MARQNPRLGCFDDGGLAPVCHVRFGSLLPGEQGRSGDMFAIMPLGPGKLRLHFRILGGELATPHESERVVEATGAVEALDFQRFRNLVHGQLRIQSTA
jgi:hypothetical protein